jgi:hypothetical protein
MSIANSYAPIKTSGDGSTDDFSFNFSIYAKSDIKVSWIVKTTGVPTVKTLGTHYDVSINLVTEGGVVTFDPAHIPPSTVWVYLESNIPDTQPTNFGVDSKLSEKSVEKMGDRQCRLLQQTNRQLARSLKLPVGSTLPDFLISSIEAGKYLRINQAADGVEMGTPSVTTTDYDGTISAGPDASKPASPSANDIYLATDTKILYVCVAGGVWTQANVSGAFFTALASIPSAAGIIPIANLASGTPDGTKFIRDDGSLQVPYTPTAANALSKSMVGFAYDIEEGVVSSTASIPKDDTLPQYTEGAEVLSSGAYTAKAVGNIIEIDVILNVGVAGTNFYCLALFVDAGVASPNAIKTSFSYITVNAGGQVVLKHIFVVADTNPHTYTARFGGASSDTWNLNEIDSADYGDKGSCVLTLREYKA